MSVDPDTTRPLPERPDLRHLKDQARDLHRAGSAPTLADAQFRIARLYGFASWPRLKAHVQSFAETGQLKAAIDANDLEAVRRLMTRNPDLHRAPIGYGDYGPLTWAAECRVPWAPPSPERLAIAQWMIDNGSNVHQGGNAPLMRAALKAERIPMMAVLVNRGADVNALFDGWFPILFAPCESLDPIALKWLLDHGADPNVEARVPTRHAPSGRATALDYAIGTYARAPERLGACIDALLQAGGRTKFDAPGVLDILRGRLDALGEALEADPELVRRRFSGLDVGSTGARGLLLGGATLLHVAAEFGAEDAARLLIRRGADVNARAGIDAAGLGGQTAIFHAATQFGDRGLSMVRLLTQHGADLNVRARIPGHYDRPDEIVDVTPLGYALHVHADAGAEGLTIAFLRAHGAVE